MGTLLVTGVAGFIGSHTATRLLRDGHRVIGLDNLNDYYDVSLKRDRLALLHDSPRFRFVEADLIDRERIGEIFAETQPDIVIHLAAQAGVRYSLENPHLYIDSNITGFLNILEGCRATDVRHLVYASSSSVYGTNRSMPFSTDDAVDHPASLYAATKKANELMAHSYSHNYGLPVTGLRLFTVYGPWGRPDMAAFLFTDAIFKGQPIKVFNQGRMKRDFTFIDDVVEGIVRIAARPPCRVDRTGNGTRAPYAIYNVGNSQPVQLADFIAVIERHTGKKAICEYFPMQPGDVEATYADVEPLACATDFRPEISIADGLKQYVDWHRSYYRYDR